MIDREDELLAQLLAMPTSARRDHLVGGGISEDEMARLLRLAESADLVRMAAKVVVPLEDDPTARLLGLVPDPAFRLDGRAFRSTRTSAGLSVSQLSARLAERGWKYSAADLNRWQIRGADDVPPAVIRATAELLGVDANQLVAKEASERVNILEMLRRSPQFAALARRWAAAKDIGNSAAELQLASRYVAAMHRGGEPNQDAALSIVEALVVSVEGSRGA